MSLKTALGFNGLTECGLLLILINLFFLQIKSISPRPAMSLIDNVDPSACELLPQIQELSSCHDICSRALVTYL